VGSLNPISDTFINPIFGVSGKKFISESPQNLNVSVLFFRDRELCQQGQDASNSRGKPTNNSIDANNSRDASNSWDANNSRDSNNCKDSSNSRNDDKTRDASNSTDANYS
jgi:hypothetical protein